MMSSAKLSVFLVSLVAVFCPGFGTKIVDDADQ